MFTTTHVCFFIVNLLSAVMFVACSYIPFLQYDIVNFPYYENERLRLVNYTLHGVGCRSYNVVHLCGSSEGSNTLVGKENYSSTYYSFYSSSLFLTTRSCTVLFQNIARVGFKNSWI